MDSIIKRAVDTIAGFKKHPDGLISTCTDIPEIMAELVRTLEESQRALAEMKQNRDEWRTVTTEMRSGRDNLSRLLHTMTSVFWNDMRDEVAAVEQLQSELSALKGERDALKDKLAAITGYLEGCKYVS